MNPGFVNLYICIFFLLKSYRLRNKDMLVMISEISSAATFPKYLHFHEPFR